MSQLRLPLLLALLAALAVLAAGGLLVIMAGAVYFHVVHEAAVNAIPALVLSGLLIAIALLRRGEAPET